MKIYLVFISVIFTTFSYTFSQKKELSLKDAVMMQNNLALVKKFIDLGIQMDFFPYPMHKHNISGKDRVHLMEKILSYIIEKNKE